MGFTAFTGRRKTEQVTARLIVRRVPRLNPAAAPAGKQGELFAVYRYHAVFTDSPESMLAAEATHRDHAVVEQVIADLKNGPLAHLPSGVFTANAAWLVCAAMAHNLTRAAGALAGAHHRRARTGTVRVQLIATPARIALRAPPGPAPTPRLALGARTRRAVPPRPARPPPRSRLTTAQQGPTGETSGNAGQTGSSTTPQSTQSPQRSTTRPRPRSTVNPGSALTLTPMPKPRMSSGNSSDRTTQWPAGY